MSDAVQCLVSVRNEEEAQYVTEAGVGLIDLKDTSTGALAMLDLRTSQAIVNAITHTLLNTIKPINRRERTIKISATVGDDSDNPAQLSADIRARFEIGVDYVKLPQAIWASPLHQAMLTQLIQQSYPLIAVFPPAQIVDAGLAAHLEKLSNLGYVGVMVDTIDKQSHLTEALSMAQLDEFVLLSRQSALMVGFAGGLQLDDVPKLVPLAPDYLGFRSGLCNDNQRAQPLNPSKLKSLNDRLFDCYQNRPNPSSKSLVRA